MNYFTDITPEQRSIIKGREKISKRDAAKIMGISRGRFDKVYVETGLIKGFVPNGGNIPQFYVRDLFEIRTKEHEFAKEKEEEKEQKRAENRFNDDYFEKLFERGRMLSYATIRKQNLVKRMKKQFINN